MFIFLYNIFAFYQFGFREQHVGQIVHRLCCCWFYTTSQHQNLTVDSELLQTVFWPGGWSLANSSSFNRHELFVILRDFSGLTQVLIPPEEVRPVSAAGFFHLFIHLMFWNAGVYPVSLPFAINAAWPHGRVCHQGHGNSQTATSGTGEQGLDILLKDRSSSASWISE